MGKSKKRAEPEVFHVEVITKARVVEGVSTDEDDPDGDTSEDDRMTKKRGKKDKKKKNKRKRSSGAAWEYYVKWAGYDSDANSWEPQNNVAGCQRLLASFWNHIGTDDRDYPVGYIVEASEKWIKKEKKYFATEFNDAQEQLRLQRERDEQERTKKSAKKKTKKSNSADVVQRPTASSSKALTTLHNSIELSDESEDDAPLKIVLPAKRKRPTVVTSDEEDVPLLSQVKPPPPKAMKTGDSSRAVPPALRLPLPKPHPITISIPVDKGKQKATEQSPVAHLAGGPEFLFSEPSSPKSPLVAAKVPSRPPLALPPPTAKPTTSFKKLPHRPTNPHTKIPGREPSAISSGSGISTKQRLAQGALNPTLPKALPLPPKTIPPSVPGMRSTVPLPKNTAIQTSFKKKPSTPVLSAGGSTSNQAPGNGISRASQLPESTLTLATLNARPSSREPGSVSPATQHPEPLQADSPQEYTTQDMTPLFPSYYAENGTSSPMISDPPPLTEAEKLLQDIMPPALAGPLMPAVERSFEPLPPGRLRKPSLPQRIPKIWKWTGKVTTDGTSEPFCDVIICDATDHLQNGLRFNVALASMTTLEFLSFHNVVDLPSILLACKPPQQLARLGPLEAKDIVSMATISSYMEKRQKIILVPILLDNNVIGHMLLFPPTMIRLCQQFQVPSEICKVGSLVATLIPWALSPRQLAKQWRKPPSLCLPVNTNMEPMIVDKTRWERSIRTKPTYHHALRILQFPAGLHKFMSEEEHNRTFCIWWDADDLRKKKRRAGLETRLLLSIMEQCRAKQSSYTSESRVIFVHVGALKTLHRLPGFLERRSKGFHVQFYTYGTHETVPPPDWGVREIYPCGGVVTFTPKAILEDPLGVLHRIRQLHGHPLWVCYILPTVLGMTAKQHSAGEDPLTAFDSGKFAYRNILTAIEEGELALLSAPPHDYSPTKSRDRRRDWLMEHLLHRPLSARNILESALIAFNSKYSNIQESDWTSAIEGEVTRDLLCMERHPAIMIQYRRYVVLKERAEAPPSSRFGLEWTTPAKFDFRDDYFPSQQ